MTTPIHLQLLLATFASWVGRRQSDVIAYFIEENRVLKEQGRGQGSCSGPSRTSRAARLEENLGADNFRTQSVAAKLVQLYSDWRKQDGARRFRTEGR